jgi:hypothetical protein
VSQNGDSTPSQVTIQPVADVNRTLRVGTWSGQVDVDGVPTLVKRIVIIDNTPIGEHVIRMTDETARYIASKILEVTSGLVIPTQRPELQ